MTTFFKKTNLASEICEQAFPLFAYKDNEYYASGTACLIDDNLAVTAKHVFEDFLWHFDRRKIKKGDFYSDLSYRSFAAQITNQGTRGNIMEISQVNFSTETDIAFIKFKKKPEESFHIKPNPFIMNFNIPKIGENITAFGYNVAKMSPLNNKQVAWDCVGATSGGIVQEIHRLKRDSIRLPFPVFRTNARFDGGMSGGPVLNEQGQLCGVVCSNLPPDEEGIEHTSYVAVLWPSLATSIDYRYKNQERPSPYPFYDYVKHKISTSKGLEEIDLIVEDKKVMGILNRKDL